MTYHDELFCPILTCPDQDLLSPCDKYRNEKNGLYAPSSCGRYRPFFDFLYCTSDENNPPIM